MIKERVPILERLNFSEFCFKLALLNTPHTPLAELHYPHLIKGLLYPYYCFVKSTFQVLTCFHISHSILLRSFWLKKSTQKLIKFNVNKTVLLLPKLCLFVCSSNVVYIIFIHPTQLSTLKNSQSYFWYHLSYRQPMIKSWQWCHFSQTLSLLCNHCHFPYLGLHQFMLFQKSSSVLSVHDHSAANIIVLRCRFGHIIFYIKVSPRLLLLTVRFLGSNNSDNTTE